MDLVNKWREEEAGILKPNVEAALEASSDISAEQVSMASQLANELGQPEQTVLANTDYAKQKSTARQIEQIPGLAEWATQSRENMAVVRDNLPAFQSLSKMVSPSAIRQGEVPLPVKSVKRDIGKISGLVQRADGTYVRHSESYNAYEAAKNPVGDWNPDTMSTLDARLLGSRLGPFDTQNVYLNENTLDSIALAGGDFATAWNAASGARAIFDSIGAAANSFAIDIEGMSNTVSKSIAEGDEQFKAIEVGKKLFMFDLDGADIAIEANKQDAVSFEGTLISPTIEETLGPGIANMSRDINLAPEKAAVTAAGLGVGAVAGRFVGQTARGAKLGASLAYAAMSFKNSLFLEAGSTYASFKDELDENGQPMPREIAAAASALYAIVAASIETGADLAFLNVIGMGSLIDKAGALASKQEAKTAVLAFARNPANKSFLLGLADKMLKTGGIEAIEEGEQEAVQALTEYVSHEYANSQGYNFNTDVSFKDFVERIGTSMQAGFWGGAIGASPMVTVVHGADYLAGKKLQSRLDNDAKINAELNTSLKDTPQKIKQEAIENMGKGGSYHFAAEDLNALYQSGVDVITPLGMTAEELNDLAVKGLEVVLPEAKVITALTPDEFEAVRPFVRETSGGKSALEFLEDEKDMPAALAEKVKVQEAAFADRIEFGRKVTTLSTEISQAINTNPNLKAQIEARGETVGEAVSNYLALVVAFSERMAAATGQPLSSVIDRLNIFSPQDKLAGWKRKSTIDGVGTLYKRFGDMSRWSEAEKTAAIDEVAGEGIFSRQAVEEAVATLSSQEALNQYIANEENKAFLREQYERPDWLKHIWGRLDGKSLQEAWPQAYKEISRSVGRGVFKSKEKGGVAIDELADELRARGLLREDEGSDELVEMLKGYSKPEFYQSAVALQADEALRKDSVAWGKRVDAFLNGKLPARQTVTMLDGVKDSQGSEFFQGYAGSMTTLDNGKHLIQLFKKANLSTILHETGHVFLAEMKMAVTSGMADQSLIDDYGKLEAWLAGAEKPGELEKQYARYAKAQFGGKEFKNLSRADKELAKKIIKEEYFARGFEAYLMDGKAPSPELQGAFARFAAWLKAVYRSAKSLNVELSDEVRGVFDRMLNIDAEVEQAALANELVAMSEEIASSLALSKKEKTTLDNLLERGKQSAIALMTKDRLRKTNELHRGWALEAWEQLLKQPEYQVRDEINKEGQALDGQALIQLIGEEGLSKLRKNLGLRAIDMDGKGQAPELVAARHGYNSVNDMVAALLRTQPKGRAIQEIVEAKQAEHDAQFKAEDYLLQTQELAERLAAVGQYIEAAMGKEKGRDIDFAAMAANHLQGLSVSRASSQLQFVGALRQAMKKERAALLKNDFESALKANKQARLHLELIKQSAAFKKETEKFERQAKEFLANQSAETDAKYVAMSLGARYGLTKPVEKIARGRDANTIAAWLKKADDAGYTLLISPEMLHGESFKPWRTMNVTDYRELVSALTQVRVVEKNMREVELHGKKLAINEAVKEATDKIYQHRNPKDTEKLRRQGLLKTGFKLLHAAHMKIEALCVTLDGGREFLGPVWNLVYKPINDAENKRVRLRKAVADDMVHAYNLYSKKELAALLSGRKKEFIDAIGRALPKREIIAIALNVGNVGNYARLKEGSKYTNEQISAIIDTLDRRDWEFVANTWAAFEKLKPEAFALQMRVTGIAPREVQAVPVRTKFGVIKGGYYPIVYDRKYLPIDTVEKIIGNENPASMMTAHGHLMDRAQVGVGTPLKLDMNVIPGALDKVVTDIAFREALIDVAKVLKDKSFRNAIETTVGNEQYQSMIYWLRDVANEGNQNRAPMDTFLGWARSSTTMMAMGFKFTTAIAQPFGITQSIHMIGADNVLYGLKQAFGDPLRLIEISDEVKAKSAFMSDRLSSFDRDVFDATKRFGKEALTPDTLLDSITPNKVLEIEAFLKKNGFIFTALMQYAVDLPTWLGAYNKGLKDFKGDDAKAVDYADMVVRLSQGSGYTKDLARIQRGSNSAKIFTMFYSYFSTVYNLTALTVADMNMYRDVQSVLNASFAFLLIYVIPSILSEIAAGRGPDEDDDEEWPSWALKQVMTYPMLSVVGVKEFSGIIEGGFGYKITAAEDAPNAFYKFLNEAVKVATAEDKDLDGKKLLKYGLEAYGYAKGLPMKQGIISAYNIWDYMDGTAPNFEVRDLVFTRQKSRR